MAASLAAKGAISHNYQKMGAPEDLAEALGEATLGLKSAEDPSRHAGAKQFATKLFDDVVAGGTPPKITDKQVQTILGSIEDPAVKKVAIGYIQGADYVNTLDTFFEAGHTERTPSRSLAKGLIETSKELNSRRKLYGDDTLHDVGKLFRQRVLDKLTALEPDKAEAVHEALASYEEEEQGRRQKEWEKAHDRWKKEQGKEGPMRGAPPPEPPPAYAPHNGKGGREKLNNYFDHLGLPKVASRVASRWTLFSSYPVGRAMAAITPMSRSALYHGVDPYGYGVEPYPKWTQVHQRDLGEKDWRSLLGAARDWLKEPVLAKSIEGIEKDTQLRAALDLAIQTHEDGRYGAQIQPTVYNMLLAKLAGEPVDETLLTIREASDKTAGISYAVDRATFLFVPGRRPVPFNVDTIREINSTYVSFVDDDGKMHDANEGDGSAIHITNWQTARGAFFTHQQEKDGMRAETRVDVTFPQGSAADVRAALVSLGKKLGFKVEPTTHTYQPSVRKIASTGETVPMTMPKFAEKDADTILVRLDKMASAIQENYEAWGMPFDAARDLVNALDKTADDIEVATFGPESLAARQDEVVVAAVRAKKAEVLQHDADEKYMNAFGNPMAPVQVESDEPYMSAYKDDQSSAVNHGKATNGRPLVP